MLTLNIPHGTVYCIDSATKDGFIVKTTRLSLIYEHTGVRFQNRTFVKKNSNAIPVKLPFQQIEIKIHAVDGYGEVAKSFRNVHELAVFLKDNDAYAYALGYVPKTKS